MNRFLHRTVHMVVGPTVCQARGPMISGNCQKERGRLKQVIIRRVAEYLLYLCMAVNSVGATGPFSTEGTIWKAAHGLASAQLYKKKKVEGCYSITSK
jgi:hypothetical protein